MKKIISAFLILSFLLPSCSTDFDLTSDWKDVTIVYGLLDKDANYNYIRIEKAFLDPKTNALSIAQIPDSIYYDSLTVNLLEFNNGNLSNTIPLERINGEVINLNKDSGIFASTPNILYRTDFPIDPSRHYKITISKSDNESLVTSETDIVSDFNITKPIGTQKVSFFPGSKYSIEWKSAKNGKMYDLIFRFHYKEYLSSGTFIKDTIVDWVIFRNKLSDRITGGDDMNYSIPSDDFYAFMSSAIKDNPDVYRVAGRIDLLYSVGGSEFYNYYQINLAQTGLTQGQALPLYTNIENGLGLFSSRSFKDYSGIELEAKTVDSLACLSKTAHLNFLKSSGVPCQ